MEFELVPAFSDLTVGMPGGARGVKHIIPTGCTAPPPAAEEKAPDAELARFFNYENDEILTLGWKKAYSTLYMSARGTLAEWTLRS
ncbi:uncharacterized protein CDV56_100500 [Aspergillus thermomutatus]|uniref:Uncharacterized protein n=1 Tax=Aspergillus thermomutatus TaxID=41047 RepID=A0A397G8R0_ASPTH|nr:uncharacterized protein CDV56_100500 [Aspergillus thermomutatus]RHZ46008.1 hypothetical protein CDV56_100500 [Aspergillus thermomutatus]